MAMAQTKETPGQALERVRPQDRALVQAANELGIRCWEVGGIRMLDLSDPELSERYNVLSPAAILMQADPNVTPRITALRMDLRDGAGDVYAVESTGSGNNRKMKSGALLKTALEKLGEAAGILELAPIYKREDGNLTVTGGIQYRGPDGVFIPRYGTREWVWEREKEKVVARCPETKWNSNEPLSEAAKEAWIEKEWIKVQEFSGPMTESKAYHRAYRKALKLKAKYTPEELQKPFLVVSTTFTPDMNDPAVVRRLEAAGQEATDLLYGPAEASAHADTIDVDATENGEPPANVDPETGEVLPDEPETFGDRPENDPKIPSGEHKGHPISVIAREHPDYVQETLLHSGSAKWGTASEEWLKYWGHATGGDDDDSGVSF